MDDPRLIDSFRQASLSELPLAESREVMIISHADDEGVQLNRGRPGARLGPDRILHYLGRMVRYPDTPEIRILKFNNQALTLSDRHQAAYVAVKQSLEQKYRVICLGGGHDYGYPDIKACFDLKPVKVLNVDAHLDLRPVENRLLNSGTPFRRLVEDCPGISIAQWGIQKHTNAHKHFKFAKDSKIKIAASNHSMPKIKGRMALSICLDAFAMIRGVSAPQTVGLSTEQGLACVRTYAKQSQLLGLYESAPSLDPQTEDSARLAALYAYHFIHAHWPQNTR